MSKTYGQYKVYCGDNCVKPNGGKVGFLRAKHKDSSQVTWSMIDNTHVRVTITNPSSKVEWLMNPNDGHQVCRLGFKIIARRTHRFCQRTDGVLGHFVRREYRDGYSAVSPVYFIHNLDATYETIDLSDINNFGDDVVHIRDMEQTYHETGRTTYYGYFKILLVGFDVGGGEITGGSPRGFKRSSNEIVMSST